MRPVVGGRGCFLAPFKPIAVGLRGRISVQTCRRDVTSARRLSGRRCLSAPRRLCCRATGATSSSLGKLAQATVNSPHLKKKHNLFEFCLNEVVRHLGEAPFLQTLTVFNGLIFQRHSVANGIEFNRDSDVFILCQSIPDCPEESWSRPVSLDGKVSDDDCCEEEISETQSLPVGNQFWGLVVKSTLFPEMQGCYLMRTTKSGNRDICTCTHYSVTRVSSGIPLADQYDASWLV